MNMIRNLSGCPVFKISGELDHHTAQAVRQKLDDAIQKDGVRILSWISRTCGLWTAQASACFWADTNC